MENKESSIDMIAQFIFWCITTDIGKTIAESQAEGMIHPIHAHVGPGRVRVEMSDGRYYGITIEDVTEKVKEADNGTHAPETS